MADNILHSPACNDSLFNAAEVTKYDSLTTEQLIDKALKALSDTDELSFALVSRLMDLNNELEQQQDDNEADVEGAMVQLAEHLH